MNRPPVPSPHPVAGIDPRVPRFNQGATAVLLVAAFLFELPLLVPVTGTLLGLGAIWGARANLWAQIFVHVVRPVLRLGPPKRRKDPGPTRFAMALGTAFLGAASLALFLAPTLPWLGWTLTLAVASLALLAATTDLCVGCEIHAFLARRRDRTAGAGRP